jgi:outer membrane protein
MASILCGVAFAESKVGFINLQRLVNESRMGQAARADIRRLRSDREAAINRKLQEVNDLRRLLNEQGSRMALQERRDRTADLQRVSKEYQRMLADAKEEIVREDRQLVADILSKADRVLKEIARQGGYTLIIKDPNAIGYLDPSVDITNEVVEELNKQ